MTALIAFVCVRQIAFRLVENPWFQNLLTVLCDDLPTLLRTSHNTIRQATILEFQRRLQVIQSFIKRAKSKIHLTFDLWSSPNKLALSAVVAHFISDKYRVESVLLGLPQVHGAHSGENIAVSVKDVLLRYSLSIKDDILCYVLDNANNNDTCVQTLGREVSWRQKDWKTYRLRCFGHILNLIAQAFIFGAQSELFDTTVEQYEQDIESGETSLHELRGPIGKLHYIVSYIRKSPQRIAEFKKGSLRDGVDPTDLTVRQDNKTRWNSVYRMIRRAIELRAQITLFCINYLDKTKTNTPLLAIHLLTDTEWDVLKHLRDGLIVFDQLTLRLESHAHDSQYGSMWEGYSFLPTASQPPSEPPIPVSIEYNLL